MTGGMYSMPLPAARGLSCPPPGLPALSFRDAMQLPGLRETRIVAGLGGIDRYITGVKVLEAPETLRYVAQGDLLLTMGFAFKGDRQAQTEVVGKVARAGAAGLALRPKPYLGEIPATMAEQADAFSIPLLDIPERVTYKDLAWPIVERLVRGEEPLGQHPMEISRQFIQLVLKGAGIQGVVQALGEIVLGLAVVADQDLNVLSSYAPPGLTGGRLPEAPDMRSLTSLPGWEVGPGEVGRISAPGMLTGGIVTPVLAGAECLGYVCAVPDPQLDELALVVVEHAASALALEMLKDRAVAAAEHRVRGQLADDLLSGSYGDAADLRRRARYLHYDLTVPHALLLVHVDDFTRQSREPDELSISPHERRFLSLVRRVVGSVHFRHLMASRGKDVIILLPLTETRDSGAVQQLAEGIVETVKSSDLGLTASVVVGRTCIKPDDFRPALIEAQRMLDLMIRLGRREQVVVFERHGVHRLLFQVEDRAGLEAFTTELLGPLASYDRARGTPYLRTLEVFLGRHRNQMRAARELNIHLNTVRYRLARIGEILGVDLNDEDARLDLLLALRIRAIFGLH